MRLSIAGMSPPKGHLQKQGLTKSLLQGRSLDRSQKTPGWLKVDSAQNVTVNPAEEEH